MSAARGFSDFEALLAHAQARHPGARLDRIEEAFAIAAGAIAPPARAPFQHAAFLFPGLSAQPWWNGAALEACRVLEACFEDLRAEALRVYDHEDGFRHNVQHDAPHRGTWGVSRIKAVAGILDEDRRRWPRTSEVVESLPGLGKMAMVSALAPGCHIEPHCGPWNVNLTVHLPLVVPEGDCALRVADEARPWREGECLVFDDSFEHEAWNRTRAPRLVLLVDLWHPALSPVEAELLQAISDLIVHQQGLEPSSNEAHAAHGGR